MDPPKTIRKLSIPFGEKASIKVTEVAYIKHIRHLLTVSGQDTLGHCKRKSALRIDTKKMANDP